MINSTLDELIWKYQYKMQLEMFNKWKDTQVWGSGKRFKSNMDLGNANIHFAFKAMGVIRLIWEKWDKKRA